MNPTGRVLALSAMAALTVLGGCASDDGAASSGDPATKTGADNPPLTITVADSQPNDKPSYAALTELGSEVELLSDGSMVVEAVADYGAEPGGEGSDEAVIEGVRDGDVEMAVVPARAWSVTGVDSMRPLQAPFLVASHEHADAIVRDASAVTNLFADLDELGVHGVTMFPESLRHLFSYTSPILTPADVAGRQVRYQPSQEVAALFTTLGATPVDTAGAEYADMVDAGTITAFDSSFSIANTSNPRPAIATGNLVLYAKVNTVVANAEFWDGLSEDQRSILTEAARTMQGWAIDRRPDERDAAAAYCADGGTVVLADGPSMAAFRDAAAPIYADLERDAAAAQTIDTIRSLSQGTTDAAVEACDPGAAPGSYDDVVAEGGDLPDGVYRFELTEDYLRDHGLSEANIANNQGIWTTRLDDGHWSIDQVAPDLTDHLEGIYQVDGNTVYWRFDNRQEGFLPLTWSTDADGTLHLTEIDPEGEPDFQFDLPWQRIGDL